MAKVNADGAGSNQAEADKPLRKKAKKRSGGAEVEKEACAIQSAIADMFEKHHGNLIASKDKEIANLRSAMASIASICAKFNAVVEDGSAFFVEPPPEIKLAEPPSEALLYNLEGNDTATALLRRWADGDVSASRELREFFNRIGLEEMGNVLVGRVEGLEPQMMACAGMVREVNLYATSQKPIEKRLAHEKLTKLFGRF